MDFSSEQSVAETYAEALLPLAQVRGVSADILAELTNVATLLADEDDFLRWCDSPLVPTEHKSATIERAFRGRVSDLICDTLGVIARHGRLSTLQSIASAFQRRVQVEQGVVAVRVTSAVPLDDSARQAVVEALTAKLGANVVLDLRVDESILGGLVVQVGDEVTDVSVRSGLEQMKDTLTRRLDEFLSRGATTPGL
ncbi:MAG: ATP synthase F1 subunit delta [Planctomycetes bacterium]|nr:ATP synthase F1 subunit delta [Planctomycetota bacterium]